MLKTGSQSSNKKLKITQIQENGSSSSSEGEQTSLNFSLTFAGRTSSKKPESYETYLQSPKLELFDDLVKMIQITVIILLLIFVFVMGDVIVEEVREYWFSETIDVGKGEGLGKSQGIISFELKKQDVRENQQKSEVDQFDISNSDSQLEFAFNFQVDEKLQQKAFEQQKTQEQTQNKKQANIKQQIQNNLDQATPDSRSVSNLEKLGQKPKPKQTFSQTVIPPEGQKLYDPVLIQLNRMQKRQKGKYKQTIYTARNTLITEQQYTMAKNLIDIMNYYDPKQKKFIVKNINDGSPDCGKHDPTCQQKQSQIDFMVRKQIQYYEQKYKQPYKQLDKELPFCVIVPSYKNNHNHNIFKNLNSIFQQQYKNYHVIYIDDASKDGTVDKVKQYIQKYEIPQDKLKLIQNPQNQKALSNIFNVAHNFCLDKEIMIIIDGDDYLLGTQVFRFLNFQYQTKKLLTAYTNYLRINQPYYVKVGTSAPYPKNIIDRRIFRKNDKIFKASHLRSFYVDLFKKIKPEDLKDEKGQFFTAANDFAIMMPVLEMAAPHIEYLPELTYLYDSGTGMNNFQSKKKIQLSNAKLVSRRKVYPQVNWKQFYPQN